MASFVSPTGYIDLDNDCEYSIDKKSTRSRELVNPKEDLSFYFNTYIIPKYGLNNINVNNCAAFMKDLEMNWTKLTPDLKQKVLDILVDGILEDEFKKSLYDKLTASMGPQPAKPSETKSTFGTKSSFGSSGDNKLIIFGVLGLVVIVLIYVNRLKIKPMILGKI